jgi:hypothetical protein
MKKLVIGFGAGLTVVASVFGFGLRSSEAVPEFEAEFKALYYRPNHNSRAKAFADAVDSISEEVPSPRGRRKSACNVCHLAGQHKRERNDFGQALDAELDRRADARNKQKIQAALKKVAKMKKNGTGPTYFELIGQGKLPGGDVTQ